MQCCMDSVVFDLSSLVFYHSVVVLVHEYIPIQNVGTCIFTEIIFQQRDRPWIERALYYFSLRKGRWWEMDVLFFLCW